MQLLITETMVRDHGFTEAILRDALPPRRAQLEQIATGFAAWEINLWGAELATVERQMNALTTRLGLTNLTQVTI